MLFVFNDVLLHTNRHTKETCLVNMIETKSMLDIGCQRHISEVQQILCYSPSHMQTRIKTLKFKFLKF
jgi:hypothetical protein